MTDWEALAAIEALIRTYRAELSNHLLSWNSRMGEGQRKKSVFVRVLAEVSGSEEEGEEGPPQKASSLNGAIRAGGVLAEEEVR